MKKILLTALLICFVSGINIETQATSRSYHPSVNVAINKYKMKNYVGCIQDLKTLEKRDPSNVIIHYYLADAYMKIGDTANATSQFDKVIALNSVPSLTSYSIQAKNCMSGTSDCKYVKLNSDQVGELIKDPQNYINTIKDKTVTNTVSNDNAEIEKLIRGKYNSRIHPEANKVIINTLLKQEKHDMNVSVDKFKSEAPTNDEIAEAVKVLAKAGINPIQQNNSAFNPYANWSQNPDYASLNMMLGDNQQTYNNNNNMMNMLPFIMQQSQNGNKQMSQEMIQTMMTSQMMPNFSFDVNPKD